MTTGKNPSVLTLREGLFNFIINFRLQFRDLNDNSILNGVEKSVLKTIWVPELKFINALGLV